MSRLPPELERLVEEMVQRAKLDDASSAEVRADLQQHLIEGLADGKTTTELAARFGDPETVGPLLAQTPAPTPTVRRPAKGDGLIASVVGDLRHALRALMKAPTLAVTVTVVLALGVGANTVVFTVLNELLLRPLPVAEPMHIIRRNLWCSI